MEVDYSIGIPSVCGDVEPIDLGGPCWYSGIGGPPDQGYIACPSCAGVVVVHVEGANVKGSVSGVLYQDI